MSYCSPNMLPQKLTMKMEGEEADALPPFQGPHQPMPKPHGHLISYWLSIFGLSLAISIPFFNHKHLKPQQKVNYFYLSSTKLQIYKMKFENTIKYYKHRSNMPNRG